MIRDVSGIRDIGGIRDTSGDKRYKWNVRFFECNGF